MMSRTITVCLSGSIPLMFVYVCACAQKQMFQHHNSVGCGWYELQESFVIASVFYFFIFYLHSSGHAHWLALIHKVPRISRLCLQLQSSTVAAEHIGRGNLEASKCFSFISFYPTFSQWVQKFLPHSNRKWKISFFTSSGQRAAEVFIQTPASDYLTNAVSASLQIVQSELWVLC